MKYFLVIFIGFYFATPFALTPYSKDREGLIHTADVILINAKNMIPHLQSVLRIARFNNLPVSMKGSEHSQGGHTLTHSALQIDLSNCTKIQQRSKDTIRVQAGATWKDVLEYLHPKGLSVSVMQSDFDFSIGGTISTNVHGWQLNKPPIVGTIEGLHLMLADSSIVYCSRTINSELFSAVIGGYGLLGIILDVDLRVIHNKVYKMERWIGETAEFKTNFYNMRHDKNSRMFFGRFNIDEDNFLNQIALITYNETSKPVPNKPLKLHPTLERLTNWIFKKTYNNNTYRKRRWALETGNVITWVTHTLMRNELLYHSVNNYLTQDVNTADILQEYFIPVEKFEKFVSVLQSLKTELMPHLMNITLRQVNADTHSILSYAPTERLCFVMYFRGEKTKAFETILEQLSVKLTSHALALNGTYYLPYRPYQTLDQFRLAYPGYIKFKNTKQKYDPNTVFNNEFYKNYLK